MRDYEEFMADVQLRKQRWWATLLNLEPVGPLAGNRSRDPEKQRVLIRRSRALLRERDAQISSRKIDVEP